ncbi:MAG: glucose 1-dehydrogenase [Clostridiaceae bacterium]|nr:glucose 1-dehydrogenase [Clostridiaceae bacterium]
MGRLDGKVAIVTGSTSGMGRDTAYLFADEGAKVVVLGRREERLKEVVENIEEKGGEALYVVADMLNPDDIENVVKQTIDRFGTVDILMNNAGMVSYEPVDKVSMEEWDRIFKINVDAYLLMTKAVVPYMREAGKGSIINIGSVAGTSARWGPGAYCSSKHAVNGLTKAMARELGPEIRVNAILPGAIATEMLDDAGGEEAMEPMKEMSPLKRIGRGKDIGTVALFFATDDSAFVTGQLLRVDGGVDC